MNKERLNEIDIHFIIGHGRSGTTLLTLLLNENKYCISTPEIKHFLYFYKKYRDIKVVTENLISDYKAYFQLLRISRQNPLFVSETGISGLGILKVGDPITYSELTKLMYLSFSADKTAEEINCIVDKNPFYTFHAEKILEVFPKAKFIVMIRDYRAYVLSNLQSRKPFEKVRSVFYYSYAWNFHLKKVQGLLQHHKEKVLLVKYEEFVTNKEIHVQRIMDFLKLNYNDNVFDFHASMKQKLATIDRNSKHYERTLKKISDLSAPVNPNRAYSWKTALDEKTMKKIESVSAKLGNEFGYAPLCHLSIGERIFFFLQGLPAFLRVSVFFALNSIRIHHYLNVVRKANYNKRHGQVK